MPENRKTSSSSVKRLEDRAAAIDDFFAELTPRKDVGPPDTTSHRSGDSTDRP